MCVHCYGSATCECPDDHPTAEHCDCDPESPNGPAHCPWCGHDSKQSDDSEAESA